MSIWEDCNRGNKAKDCGQLENKWLMINIQNVQDFACQCLNRDVWSNEAVRTIIREHFIFWQVYHDSEEGQRYIQFYKLNKCPYISILDPWTGQKMVEWNELDVASFLEQVTGFLAEHGQLDGPSCNAPEDSQLEAAIRASLQETHYESSVPQSPQSEVEDDSDAEPFSDSEGLISIDGSDNDTPEPPREKTPPQERREQKERPTVAPARTNSEPPSGENHCSTVRGRTPVPPSGGEPLFHRRGENHCSTSAAPSNATQPSDSDGPESDDGPKARLMLRYPDGQREQIALSSKAKLMALVRHVQSKVYPNERFELVTNFPRRKLAHLDYDITRCRTQGFVHRKLYLCRRGTSGLICPPKPHPLFNTCPHSLVDLYSSWDEWPGIMSLAFSLLTLCFVQNDPLLPSVTGILLFFFTFPLA
ncbi:hypothetical protein NHX12_004243 [Muraenolepis orangiensis]|uniref:UBX domain-containing protein n=1 Tax=Muraenolepis orangiensis TaxID=630683 RepID=A0A9Q0DV42_9TELE|nr:hypothetical protein NHX12_004243 [Muraenolepis orangiensis]